MKENRIETIKNEEENKESMSEKVHYEIKFVETEDGYRLEASGDKDALRRLGIGPNMVGKRRGRGPGRPGHGRPRHGRRGAGARHGRRMNRSMRFAMQGGRGPGRGPHSHHRDPRGPWQEPTPWKADQRETWEW